MENLKNDQPLDVTSDAVQSEIIHKADRMKDEATDLKEGGGLQNMAELLSQGYTVAAYVMNAKTKAAIDEFIATYPERPKPFRSAPIEIDEEVGSIHVRLAQPEVREEDPDGILKEMSRIAEHLGADPAKPITGTKQ